MSYLRVYPILAIIFLLVAPTAYATNSINDSMRIYNQALITMSTSQKIRYLQDALELYAQNYEAAYELGRTYLRNHNEEEGIRYLAYVISSEDDELKLKAYRALFSHYFHREDPDKVNSDKWLRQLVQLEDNYFNNYLLGDLNGPHGLCNYEDAITFYQRAQELREDDTYLSFLVAENYYHLGDYKQTIRYLEQYPNANSDHQNAFRMLVTSYYQLSLNDTSYMPEALAQCNDYLSVWPNDEEIVSQYNQIQSNLEPYMASGRSDARDTVQNNNQVKRTPTILNAQEDATVTRTFRMDYGSEVLLKELNLSNLYNQVVNSSDVSLVGEDMQVKVYVNRSTTIDHSEPIFSGVIYPGKTTVELNVNQRVRYLRIEVTYRHETDINSNSNLIQSSVLPY